MNGPRRLPDFTIPDRFVWEVVGGYLQTGLKIA